MQLESSEAQQKLPRDTRIKLGSFWKEQVVHRLNQQEEDHQEEDHQEEDHHQEEHHQVETNLLHQTMQEVKQLHQQEVVHQEEHPEVKDLSEDCLKLHHQKRSKKNPKIHKNDQQVQLVHQAQDSCHNLQLEANQLHRLEVNQPHHLEDNQLHQAEEAHHPMHRQEEEADHHPHLLEEDHHPHLLEEDHQCQEELHRIQEEEVCQCQPQEDKLRHQQMMTMMIGVRCREAIIIPWSSKFLLLDL